MSRCIEIARNGLGTTAPNPMVGCVIVHDNKIIGEGFTSPYGGNHAEVNAIRSVKDKDQLSSSTLYVTLEPCSHYGKTPPCTDIIEKYKIPKVVIGTVDSNKVVNGKGIEKLKSSSRELIVGILEDYCREHHKRFFTFQEKKRPYIILKWAESADGYLSPLEKVEKAPVWITNQYSRQLVHKWRSEEQSILVGANTVREDNPSLTVRNFVGKNPARIVLDPNGSLDLKSQIFNEEAPTVIIGKKGTNNQLQAENLIKESINWSENDKIASQVCKILYSLNITSVLVEGGGITLQTFIKENLWDEARIFHGEIFFSNGTPAPKIKGELIFKQNIGKDRLSILQND